MPMPAAMRLNRVGRVREMAQARNGTTTHCMAVITVLLEAVVYRSPDVFAP